MLSELKFYVLDETNLGEDTEEEQEIQLTAEEMKEG
jgi:hypothetical protein